MSPRALVWTLVALLFGATPASAFCGFYVARADTTLYNQASQVVLVRDEDRTVLTMANDYKGSLTEFAMVIPVPTFLEREQIHVAEHALIEHLDAYTAPRLVEYFDGDPCNLRYRRLESALPPQAALSVDRAGSAKSLGVTIEAEYTVGEYDILILSAKESAGLVTWLVQNDYRIPEGAESVVSSYLKQGMRFFVAKVNLEEQTKLGYQQLRPLQIAFESPKFVLPIRLGMVNADGPQELFVYALTRTGRVETTNYRTVKLPTGMDLPPYVKDDFAPFYRDMFQTAVARENGNAVFLEYAWDMAWCDPCAADPLSAQELRQLGVFWVDEPKPGIRPPTPMPMPRRPQPAPQDVFVTRLHVRYDAEHFPDDLAFQSTGDRQNFQGRYVLRHPFTGEASCEEAQRYFDGLAKRQDDEAKTLANLTGWDIAEIRERIGLEAETQAAQPEPEDEPWWKRLWH
ncbi:MAG: DUF2330 domain-containing protein [Myxococcota bacterium]